MKTNKIPPLFLIIWFGDFISTIGSGLTAFALGVYVFKLTGQATAVGMVVFFTFLPAVILRPVGGVLADRLNRLSLMFIGNLGSVLSIGLIFYFLQTHPKNLILIYIGVTLSSICYALINPAYKACTSDFLPKELYSKAGGLMQLSSASQFLIAPFLGGILMSLMNINYVLMIDILTFVFSLLSITIVKLKNVAVVLPKKQKHHFWLEIKEGWQAITIHPGILILIILISLLLFYVGLIQALLTPMVLSFATEAKLGVAQSACAIGMLLTSVIISMAERKRSNVSVLTISLLVMGIFFSFIGFHENLWAVIIPGFLFSSTIPYANSSIDVLIRSNIDNEKQGRAWSLISLVTYTGAILAYGLSGFLADKVFNPLLMPGGALASSLGHIFGVGAGRGIAFIFFISGIFIVCISLLIYRSKSIWQLEE